jgi:hypothetical protein
MLIHGIWCQWHHKIEIAIWNDMLEKRIKQKEMRRIILFILILILSACTSASNTQTVSTATKNSGVIVSPTIEPTLNNSSTPTIGPITLPAKTLMPTSTLTPTAAQVPIKQSCANLSSTNILPGSLSGRIPFTSSDTPYPSPFLLDLATGEKITFEVKPDEQTYFVEVSPDHKWVALMKNKIANDVVVSQTLLIVDYDGDIQASIQFEPSWMYMNGWADSNHVVIVEQDPDDYNANLIILNPFTKEVSTYSTKLFPGIYLVFPGPWGFYYPPILFGPTLNHLVYDQSGELNIWNLTSGKEDSSLAISTNEIPAWSNDGTLLAIVGQLSISRTDLFISTIDGNLERVTYLDDYFKKVQLSRPSWSPDNRYIGFGMIAENYPISDTYSLSSSDRAHLAVLDTQYHQVTDYCITFYQFFKPPIWSPIDRQVIITQSISYGMVRTYIVNLQTGIATKLLEDNYIPIGWVSNR